MENEIDPAVARHIQDEAQMQGADYTPVRDAQSTELSLFMLRPDDILEFIENELRGRDYDYITNAWIEPDNPEEQRVLNENGIRAVMNLIRWHVNKVTFLTNLEDEHIYSTIYNLSNNLTQLLFNNGDIYGIKWEKAHQNLLVDNVCNITFMALRKAFADKERLFFGSHTQIIHRKDETPQGQQGKKWGIF